tara:strand:- start:1687 stop:2958 length:1272 start_codon:yes stop_codon:yes gene_type:complete
MKAFPHCEFFVFDGTVYHNNVPEQSGATNYQVRNVSGGYVSLYEYNIDRMENDTGRSMFAATSSTDSTITFTVNDTGLIYPWITKTGENFRLGTISTGAYSVEYDYGDVLVGSYPLSASITRELLAPYAGSEQISIYARDDGTAYYTTGSAWPHYNAMRNTLDAYTYRSLHFRVSGSAVSGTAAPTRNLDRTLANLISIPSIFYGTQIHPGTVSARWYFTGSLVGELRDIRQDGVLYEVSGTNVGAVAGIIMYEHGVMLLTGSWDLGPTDISLESVSPAPPSWLYFCAGANDGKSVDTVAASFSSASFGLSFNGETKTQVVTMFAQAGRDKVNFSNNPTYIAYGQNFLEATSSQIYEENSERTIHNTVSSSYSDYSAPFKRQVYISRIGIYDKHKNLMGVATLANPVLKEEDQDLTFKIKLDI